MARMAARPVELFVVSQVLEVVMRISCCELMEICVEF